MRTEKNMATSKLKRLPTDDFNRDVTAVAMDERFVLVGQVDGKLSAVYVRNGNRAFSEKISEHAITAVCCEEQDDTDNQIFYAGDSAGNLYTVNKKGKVVASNKIPSRKGEILVIANRSKYSIYAYTTMGSTSFSHATSDFKKGNFSTSSANYSFDGDGTFHTRKGSGDHAVIQFDGRTPSRVVASVAVEFGKVVKNSNYEQVFVYAVIDEQYENLIEEGTAETTLEIRTSSGKKKMINFEKPVKQVMSCRHHIGEAEADHIYIMLWNGSLYRCTGKMLSDPEVDEKALDLKLIVSPRDDPAVDNDDDDSDDDDDDGEFRGFCVYGKKIVMYGNDGLFTADVTND